MDVQLFEIGLGTLLVLVITMIDWLTPALTRRDLLFGVTVMPGARDSAAGRRIVRGYRFGVTLLAIIAIAGLTWAALVLPIDALAGAWLAVAIIAFTLISPIPYLLAHSASKKLAVAKSASAPPETPHSPTAELRPRRYGDYVPLVWEILPLAIIAATVAYLVPHYANAPALIPQHYGVNGEVNRYAPKSIGTFFILVWAQLFIEVLITFMSLLVVGSKALPGEAETRFRRTWLRGLVGIKVAVLLLLGIDAVIIAANVTSTTLSPWVLLAPTLVFLVVVIGGVIVLSLRTGQGGSRLSSDAPATDRLDDRYWKFGAIYVNGNDPSIFVERRFGVGWTLNFGNPRGVLVMLGMFVAVAVFATLIILVSQPH